MRNIRIKTMLLGIIVIAIAMFIPNMSKAAFVSISAYQFQMGHYQQTEFGWKELLKQ